MSLFKDPTRALTPLMQLNSYKKIERGAANLTGTLYLPYDPQGMDSTFENCISEDTSISGESGSSSFKKAKSSDLKVSFLLDDTTYSNIVAYALPNMMIPDSADKIIKKLLDMCQAVDGVIHEPPYVTLKAFMMPMVNAVGGGFNGRLTSMTIKNEIVDLLGSRVKAKVDCTFKECLSDAQIKKQTGRSSPDLTHILQTLAGDRLTSKVNNIYGDPMYVYGVAKHNNLNSVRQLNIGEPLEFPPLER